MVPLCTLGGDLLYFPNSCHDNNYHTQNNNYYDDADDDKERRSRSMSHFVSYQLRSKQVWYQLIDARQKLERRSHDLPIHFKDLDVILYTKKAWMRPIGGGSLNHTKQKS